MRLSFKGTIRQIHALWPFSAGIARQRDLSKFYDALLKAAGSKESPNALIAASRECANAAPRTTD